MTQTTSSLPKQLAALGLTHTAINLDAFTDHVTKNQFSTQQLLEYLIDTEQKHRQKKSVERRLTRSKIGRFKPMIDFDWAWPTSIDRALVDSALNLEFIRNHGNVVLLAPEGLGKTMLARNIVYNAVLAGHHALFLTAAQLLNDLAACESARILERKFKFYCQAIELLCIDEIGYLNFEPRAADLLFQVISRRHEKKSLILTTNLAFSDWPKIFPNASCTVALVDRIVEHADIIVLEGDSYRRRAAIEKTAKAKARTPAKK